MSVVTATLPIHGGVAGCQVSPHRRGEQRRRLHVCQGRATMRAMLTANIRYDKLLKQFPSLFDASRSVLEVRNTDPGIEALLKRKVSALSHRRSRENSPGCGR